MVVQLDNGTRLRVVDKEGQEPKTDVPNCNAKFEAHRIEVDSNKNGVFGDKGDLIITDRDSVSRLSDEKQGNFEGVNLPGVDKATLEKIDLELARNHTIHSYIAAAAEAGQKANSTPKWNVVAQVRLGKAALGNSHKAFHLAPNNTAAKIGYGVALCNSLANAPHGVPDRYLGLKEKGTTAVQEVRTVLKALSKETDSIAAQMVAKELLELHIEKSTDSSWKNDLPASPEIMKKELAAVEQNLRNCRMAAPQEYAQVQKNIGEFLGNK
jgi:hypothetical protein